MSLWIIFLYQSSRRQASSILTDWWLFPRPWESCKVRGCPLHQSTPWTTRVGNGGRQRPMGSRSEWFDWSVYWPTQQKHQKVIIFWQRLLWGLKNSQTIAFLFEAWKIARGLHCHTLWESAETGCCVQLLYFTVADDRDCFILLTFISFLQSADTFISKL